MTLRLALIPLLLTLGAATLPGCPAVDTDQVGMNHHDKLTGEKTGLWTTYYPNGKKQSEGRYDQGKKVGPWTYWDANGALDRREVWAAGILANTAQGDAPLDAAPEHGLGERMGQDADQGVGGQDADRGIGKSDDGNGQ